MMAMLRRPSLPLRCCPQCSNVFSSETARPIKAKLYMKHTLEGGTKVCINGPGHLTKMAAMAINSKYF